MLISYCCFKILHYLYFFVLFFKIKNNILQVVEKCLINISFLFLIFTSLFLYRFKVICNMMFAFSHTVYSIRVLSFKPYLIPKKDVNKILIDIIVKVYGIFLDKRILKWIHPIKNNCTEDHIKKRIEQRLGILEF